MTNKTILEAPEESLEQIAIRLGATHYSPPPMRAVRGLSFTFDQLGAFVDELASSQAAAEQPTKEAGQGERERARLEAWMEAHDSDALVFKDRNGKYLNAYTQDRWGMWQVAAQFNLSARQPDQAAEQPEKEGLKVRRARKIAFMDAMETYLKKRDIVFKGINKYAMQQILDECYAAMAEVFSTHHPDSGEWVSVPREPTEEMLLAAVSGWPIKPGAMFSDQTEVEDTRACVRDAIAAGAASAHRAPKDQQP